MQTKKLEINKLRLRKLGIDTYNENIVYISSGSEVCRAEGFKALTRVVVKFKDKSVIATLNVVHDKLFLNNFEASLSEIAFQKLGASDNDFITIHHLDPISSLSLVRAKIFGKKLAPKAYLQIMKDITDGKYSSVHLSAFITACAGNTMDVEEITSLTRAMINTGYKLKWNARHVFDKHCVGGIPGNRTTPIIVAIVAEAGLMIPKTSSRAITSPAGTSDTLETMTKVDLNIEEMRKVVQKEGGCFCWGGAIQLSPSDDILIKVERALDIDSAPQLIASVLSKKVSAGSTDVLIDIPYGPTAKLRTYDSAMDLQQKFIIVANALGINVKVIVTEGFQPIGRGIGPALEAIDVLEVLRNEKTAPADLRKKSLEMAGDMLEMSGKAEQGKGFSMAEKILVSGKALKKFYAICKAQGHFTEPKPGAFIEEIKSAKEGVVSGIDNRKLAKAAKLAGAPLDAGAGIYFMSPLGRKVEKGETLMKVYAESEGAMKYTLDYIKKHKDIIVIKDE